MKANELRIGNWVEIIQPQKGVYTTLQQSSFTVDLEAHFREIKLTEKFLLDFGFEKTMGWDDMIYFDNNGIHIYECGDAKRLWFEFENEIKIKSVHQLQNLYFALTGEELQLNK